ncbi:low affinity iron permease family protein [Sphingosinicella sp. CPCC 101087]|uniref:low affinity iron permease family protein n=1 Tax=Sphingosinicella sp. CPCC 101087 TaxID=2497754 RepID=UPI00101C441C|nr:low affinity iron permease family protein [Sphingosinicella sp. CPCC 101087]
MDRLFTRFAGHIAAIVGQPAAFAAAFLVVLLWAASGPVFGFSDTWQLVINTGTTIVTFLMVFLIQNSQNRDAAAMQAKLDELLRAVDQARPQFIGIEHLTDVQVEAIRARLEEEAVGRGGKAATADESVEQLLKRF